MLTLILEIGPNLLAFGIMLIAWLWFTDWQRGRRY